MMDQRLDASGLSPEDRLRQVCESVPEEMTLRKRGDLLDAIELPVRALDVAAGYLGFAAEQSEDGNNELVARFRRPDGLAVWLVIRDDVRDRVLGMCVPPGDVPANLPDLWYPLPLGDGKATVDYVCDWLILADPESPLWEEPLQASRLFNRVVGSVPLSCYYIRRYDDAPERVMVWFNCGRTDYVVAFIVADEDDSGAPSLMHCSGGSMGPMMASRDLDHAAEYIKHCLTLAGGENRDAHLSD